MFVDVSFFLEHYLEVIAFTAILIVVKVLVILGLFAILKHPLNVGFMTAFGLAHIGEFSFIILKLTQEHDIFDSQIHQLFLSAALLSMFSLPFALKAGKKISRHDKLKKEFSKQESSPALTHHTIIAGLGVIGQNIIRVMKLLNIPYAIIDINPANVKKYRAVNTHVYYGNADRRENLLQMGIKEASLVLVAINDIEAAKRTVALARDLNKQVKIIVRVNFLAQVENFYKLGADLVLSEDMETSLIIIHHVLKFHNMPEHVSRIQTNLLRKEHYRFFLKKDARESWKMAIVDAVEQDNELFFISPNSHHVGKKVTQLEPFKLEDIKILGVIRQNNMLTKNVHDIELQSYDTLLFCGNHAIVFQALDWLEKNN
jgi:CPA2 family monovalent cation:H+ antiporter-2